MDFTEAQIEAQLNKIPKDVRDALTSPQMAGELGKIGDEHDLLLDDIDELVSQTGLVMLGLVHPNDFIRNIQGRLVLERDEAVSVAKDVNARVFQPIRQSLQRLHETRSAFEEEGESGSTGGIDKHSVLNEIESPSPARVKADTPPNNIPFKINRAERANISLNRIETAPAPVDLPAEKSGEALPEKGGILKERLSGMVHVTKEESVQNDNSKSIKNVGKPSADPYRESIN